MVSAILGSGFGGLILALVIGFIYAVTMIFQSTNVVMAMNGAREVDEQTAPNLYHVVEDMAMVAQIPMPRVFIVDDPSMNAFATGSSPKNAAVAATTGLLAVMFGNYSSHYFLDCHYSCAFGSYLGSVGYFTSA